ncbi:hypothetical protein MmiAt1_16940 [Methanimicrococcus sp. At1]|uniref:Prepilin type IV endopeptidase peptidase domain-containing protein n=1 Tax=Methanimicrococcus hacksteinii TaxID=3028293 RepID=A0ABU3VRR3_9EURY|nr:hypothetical protein [Methanimicrococcus sp. At1]
MNTFDLLAAVTFVKIILFSAVLFIAAVQDFRTQTVSDNLWLTASFLLMPIIILEISAAGISHFADVVFSFIFFFFFSAICFSLRIFGGADCKAFLLIAAGFPIPIVSAVQNFQSTGYFSLFDLFDLFLSFPFAVLFNSLLLSLIFILVFFFKPDKQFCSAGGFNTKNNSRQSLFQKMFELRFPFLPSIAGGFFLSVFLRVCGGESPCSIYFIFF